MKVEDVVRAGEEVKKLNEQLFVTLSVWVYLGLIIVFILGLLIFNMKNKSKNIMQELVSLNGLILMIGSILILFALSFGILDEKDTKDKEKNIRISNWERNYVKPYIDTLESKRMELKYIKINEEKNNTDIDIRKKDTNQVFVKIGYIEDEHLETKNVMAQVKMTLPDTEKPYATYKIIEKDLGFEYSKGMQEVKVYLPSDYKLN